LGFGVEDLGFWGFVVEGVVDWAVGGLGFREMREREQILIGLAQRAGKYPLVTALSRA
jgi:hypothetical protein